MPYEYQYRFDYQRGGMVWEYQNNHQRERWEYQTIDNSGMQNSMQGLMDDSLLNQYANSTTIKKVDLQAHKFLVLRKNEFCEARVLACTPSLSSLKKKAGPLLGIISGGALAMVGIESSVATTSGFFLTIGSFLYAMPRSCRLMEQDADDGAIKKADIEELKGGMRFFKACQKKYQRIYQKMDKENGFFDRLFFSPSSGLGGLFFSTNSDESWLPSLALNPSWKDRITKIEKELQSRGEDISVTEEDQQKIVLLEKAV